MCRLNLDTHQPLVLTLDEVTVRLSISADRLKTLIRNRKLIGFRIGRSWRITTSSVEKWSSQNSKSPQEVSDTKEA